jgi:hypothetical protein
VPAADLNGVSPQRGQRFDRPGCAGIVDESQVDGVRAGECGERGLGPRFAAADVAVPP